MKKTIALLLALLLFFGCFTGSVSAGQKNLCEELKQVGEFHHIYNCYENPDIDVGGYIEREVKSGELYSASTIIAAAEMLYLADISKYTVVKQPERDSSDLSSPIVVQKPYVEYVCVPENEYISFVKSRFNVNDSLLNELRNFKVRNFSTHYDENGTPIFNSADNTYIVPILNHISYTRNPYRKFIGYVKDGGNYDVYLNLATLLDWENPPADKKEYVDYYKETYQTVNPTGPGMIDKVRYYAITNDWMKYTVSFDGSTVKYISNIKVNSVPENLIRPGDIVPDEVISTTTSQPTQSTTESVITDTVSDIESDVIDEVSSETVSEEDITDESEETVQDVTQELKVEKENSTVLPIVIVSVVLVATAGAAAWYFLIFKKK